MDGGVAVDVFMKQVQWPDVERSARQIDPRRRGGFNVHVRHYRPRQKAACVTAAVASAFIVRVFSHRQPVMDADESGFAPGDVLGLN